MSKPPRKSPSKRSPSSGERSPSKRSRARASGDPSRSAAAEGWGKPKEEAFLPPKKRSEGGESERTPNARWGASVPKSQVKRGKSRDFRPDLRSPQERLEHMDSGRAVDRRPDLRTPEQRAQDEARRAYELANPDQFPAKAEADKPAWPNFEARKPKPKRSPQRPSRERPSRDAASTGRWGNNERSQTRGGSRPPQARESSEDAGFHGRQDTRPKERWDGERPSGGSSAGGDRPLRRRGGDRPVSREPRSQGGPRGGQPPGQSAPFRDERQELRSVTPTSWSDKGEAVMDGEPPVWVWGGIPGESAYVQTRRSGQNRQYVVFKGTDEPSKNRVEPPCTRYTACGGCPWLHVDGPGQADARVSLVQRAFDGENISVQVQDLVSVPDGLENFRHVSKLVCGVSDRGNYRLGAPGRFNRRIVSIPQCNILTPTLREVTLAATHAMIDLDVRPYVHGEGGLLRYVQVRQSLETGDVMVTLIGAYRARILDRMAETIASKVPAVIGVHLHVNEREDNNIYDRDEDGIVPTYVIFGKETLTEKVGQVKVQVGPTDFFQTNPAVGRLLVDEIIEQAKLSDGVPVVDLYCGVGGTTLNAAKITGWALGIEGNTTAIAHARAAAGSQVIPAEFVAGSVDEVLEAQQKRLAELRPVVLVNPARRGLEEGVGAAIRLLRPRRIVYTSCNPKALARDVAGFVEEGWSVTSVKPFDMFPNTQHVEVVAVLLPPEGDDVQGKRAPRRRTVKKRSTI